jgi:hypothetical protein
LLLASLISEALARETTIMTTCATASNCPMVSNCTTGDNWPIGGDWLSFGKAVSRQSAGLTTLQMSQIVLCLFRNSLVMDFVMASLMTRRSVDGMVVIASTAKMAMSASTVTSIIPIVQYLIHNILVMVTVISISSLTTPRSADGTVVIAVLLMIPGPSAKLPAIPIARYLFRN